MSNNQEPDETPKKVGTGALSSPLASSELYKFVHKYDSVTDSGTNPPPSGADNQVSKGKISRPTKQKNSPKASTLAVIHGHATLRAYPVTGGELFTLGALGFFASLFFSMGAGAVGFSFDIFKDLELTAALDAAVKARWETYENIAFKAGIGLFIAGTILVGLSGITIKRIIDRTKFSEGS